MAEDVPARSTVTTQEQAIEEEQKEREMERSFRAAPTLNKSPLHGLWALTNRDLVKWYKNPIQLIISLVQPVVWLGLFGLAFNIGKIFTSLPGVTPAEASVLNLGTFGTSSYFSYLAAGMLAFIILFTAAFSGMSVVWDRRFGFMNKALSTPVGRGAIVVAKISQSTVRSLIQAAIVLVIAVVLGSVGGVQMDTSYFSVLTIGGSFVLLFLMSFGLSSLFVMLALRSSDWQTQMAIINLLNLPLLFASNAMLPVKTMPAWLQGVVGYNPVSYAVDGVRQMLLGSGSSAAAAAGYKVLAPLWVDFGVLAAFAAILSVLGIVLSWRLLSK